MPVQAETKKYLQVIDYTSIFLFQPFDGHAGPEGVCRRAFKKMLRYVEGI